MRVHVSTASIPSSHHDTNADHSWRSCKPIWLPQFFESSCIHQGWKCAALQSYYNILPELRTMLEPKVPGLRMSTGHPHNSAPHSAKHQYNADDTPEDRQMACATNQRAGALRRKSFHALTGPLCQVWVPKSTRRVWVILQRGGCSNIWVGHIRQRRLYMWYTKNKLRITTVRTESQDLFSWQVQTSWLKAKAPLSESSSWVVADFRRRSWTLSWKVWKSPQALHSLVKSTSKSWFCHSLIGWYATDICDVQLPTSKHIQLLKGRVFTFEHNVLPANWPVSLACEVPSVLLKLMLKGCERSADAKRRAPSSANTLSLWRLAASFPPSSARPWRIQFRP